MKKFFIISIGLITLFIACKSNKNNTFNDKDTTNQQSTNYNNHIILKILPNIIKQKEFEALFNEYLNALNQQITSHSQIEKIFELRDSLNPFLGNFLSEYFYQNTDYELQNKIGEELKLIGFVGLYAEGMIYGLGETEILSQEIQKYSPEDFQLYAKFLAQYSDNQGGEYPFYNTYGYAPAVETGEKLYKKFPQSIYFQKIKKQFYLCVSMITDIHKASIETGNGKETSCFYSNLTVDTYPYITECSTWDSVLRKIPNSSIIPIIKLLKKNCSYIEYNYKSDTNYAYLIYTDICKDYDNAQQKTIDYIFNGNDIVHIVDVIKGNDTLYYVCYRFYDKLQTTKQFYNDIAKKVKSAKIAKVTLYNEFIEDITL